MELLGLPSGFLEMADDQTGSGYTFTFSPTVCGLPAINGNPNAAVGTGSTLNGTASATAAPTLITIPLISTSTSQVQNTIRLSLRTGPGVTYTRIAYIPRGTILTLIAKVPMQADNIQWIKVTDGVHTGWIVAFYTNIPVRVLRNLPIDPTAVAVVQATATPAS